MADTEQVATLPQLENLSKLLEEKTETFAFGCNDIQTAAITAAKYLFDLSVESEKASIPHIEELLSSLTPSQAPQTRSQSRAGVSKDSAPSPKEFMKSTPITSLYVDGMDDEQIWAQLDLRTKNICTLLDRALDGEIDDKDEEGSDNSMDADLRLQQALEALEKGEDVDMDFLDNLYSDADSILDDSNEDEDEDSLDSDNSQGEDKSDGGESVEQVMSLRDQSEDESEDDDYEGENEGSSSGAYRKSGRKSYTTKTSELDDGFFILAAFNAETEQAEARSSSRGHLGSDDDSSDEDNAPIDLFAPIDEPENFEEDDLENNSTIYYRDFFEPPKSLKSSKTKPTKTKPPEDLIPKKSGQVRFHEEVKVRKIRANGKNLSLYSMDLDLNDDMDYEDEDDDLGEDVSDSSGADNSDLREDIHSGDDDDEDDEDGESQNDFQGNVMARETIERLKDDLFAEEEEDRAQDMTTHEKRLLALREQIQELEQENVGEKDWVLKGEATSRARPQNSLLEEDLEFERVMKAVPVITEDVVKGLEERIKARILETRFDDVVRVRIFDDKPFLPSRLLELQDTKSKQSLAQIYENEYVASQAGGATVDDRDGKLQKEHEEIDQLWEKICGKLDALSNAHFVPKQPKATISRVANVSTTTLESALPTTKSTSTLLAPEEVFAPKSAQPRAKSELTPAEKRSLHGKERKAKKKQRDVLEKSVDKYAKMKGIGGVRKQKQAALKSVVKLGKGVSVVGKEGKITSFKKARERKAKT